MFAFVLLIWFLFAQACLIPASSEMKGDYLKRLDAKKIHNEEQRGKKRLIYHKNQHNKWSQIICCGCHQQPNAV